MNILYWIPRKDTPEKIVGLFQRLCICLFFVFIDELYELWKDNFLRLLLIYCQLCISISVSKNETTDEDTYFINVVSLSAVTLW